MRCALLFLVPAIALSGCATTAAPNRVGNNFFMAGDSQCSQMQPMGTSHISCYDKNGKFTGSRQALSQYELQAYLNQRQQTSASIDQSFAASQNFMQQVLQNGNQMIQQGQQSMSNLQPYSYQNTDGQWVYCNRTSTYTVNCRTQ